MVSFYIEYTHKQVFMLCRVEIGLPRWLAWYSWLNILYDITCYIHRLELSLNDCNNSNIYLSTKWSVWASLNKNFSVVSVMMVVIVTTPIGGLLWISRKHEFVRFILIYISAVIWEYLMSTSKSGVISCQGSWKWRTPIVNKAMLNFSNVRLTPCLLESDVWIRE